MSSAISNAHPSHRSLPCEGFHSVRVALETTFNDIIHKVQDFVTSPMGQGAIGFGLGLQMHRVYGPITAKILTALDFAVSADPFMSIGLPLKILLTPLICIIHPLMEELEFREILQGYLKQALEAFYINHNLSNSSAQMAIRVSAVFLTSVIFGLVHFANALVFWCNPVLFVPQVIAATIMGMIFGLAKEMTGNLEMPIGMHIGNNTLAWAHMVCARV